MDGIGDVEDAVKRHLRQLVEAQGRRRLANCPSCDQDMSSSHAALSIQRCQLPRYNGTVAELTHSCCSDPKPKKLFMCIKCGAFNQKPNKIKRSAIHRSTCVAEDDGAMDNECDWEANNNTHFDPGSGIEEDAVTSAQSSTMEETTSSLHHPPSPGMEDEGRTEAIREEEERIRALGVLKGNFNEATARFLEREHRKAGDGMKGAVYNATVDNRATTDFPMDEKEVQYHLHITSVHQDISAAKSKDVTSMTRHIVNQCAVEKTRAMADVKQSFIDAMVKKLEDLNFGDDDREALIGDILEEADELMVEREKERSNERETDHPTEYKHIRNQHLEGANSIMKAMPIPTVSIKNNFAYIPAEDIVNYILAITEQNILTFEDESDWTNEEGEYEGLYFERLHEIVKGMKERGDMPEGTRSHIIRLWSDGFGMHAIKIDNKFNNLQVFTLTVVTTTKGGRGKKFNTLPFALGFKQNDHSVVLNQLLDEVFALSTPKERYYGTEKRVCNSSFFLQAVMNDYPERVANAVLSNMGLFHHRWAYSCLYCEDHTPSCQVCEVKRVESFLNGDFGAVVKDCGKCTDWMSPNHNTVHGHHENAESYPIPVGPREDQSSNKKECSPTVKLGFEMLCNSWNHVKALQSDDTKEKKTLRNECEDYLQKCCVPPLVASEMIRLAESGEEWTPPAIWKMHKYGLMLEYLAHLPMHGCALGVEKNLTSRTPWLVNKRKPNERNLWKQLLESMKNLLKEANRASIDWCLPMSFSGKEKDEMGTANWISEHYVSFTRLSLVLFSPLESLKSGLEDEEKLPLFKAFRRVRVLWFCLCSHMFADKPSSSVVVDNYVKLFLSACAHLWDIHVKLDKTTKRRKKVPFFVSGTIYLSLLNFKEAIDFFGSMRNLWEGGSDGEGYIQNVKKEVATMRHTPEFLKTIIEKILRTACFSQLNAGNPLDDKTVYNRTLDVQVYKAKADIDLLLQRGSGIVSGIVNAQGQLLICANEVSTKNEKCIAAYPVLFEGGDREGYHLYDLWYTKAKLASKAMASAYRSRKELLEAASDYFILVPHQDEDSARTVLCKSWRVRHKTGELKVPTPSRETLLGIDQS